MQPELQAELGVCLDRCIPRDITMEILYFQETPIEKRIIEVTLDLGGEFDQNFDDSEYSITFVYYPLNWMDLIVKFAFSVEVFLYLFLAIGLFTVTITALYWLLTVSSTSGLRTCLMTCLMVGPATVRGIHCLLVLTA